jgi:hypothetical protein
MFLTQETNLGPEAESLESIIEEEQGNGGSIAKKNTNKNSNKNLRKYLTTQNSPERRNVGRYLVTPFRAKEVGKPDR